MRSMSGTQSMGRRAMSHSPAEILAAMAELVEAVRQYLAWPHAEDGADRDYYDRKARLIRALEAMEGRERR